MTDPKDSGAVLPRKLKPNRRPKARTKQIDSPLEVIERLLHKPVDTVKDGQPTKMSALEAIVFQLLQKSLAGDKRADRALQKFTDFADRNSVSELQLVFVDNDYTRAFAASPEPKDA
ncbi:hypothetical protein IVB27_04795 [Bradyrhizobium sp. 197]|jgi:hypothetical protein|uniref:DUF5681 domain-containing protein n=1 Tax=Bradyrhizobium sp. 197 TaxID=2782663 RepID=UPI001FFC1518|nr:DUF5681 domain-containing protein [Bradyrhizobium sp. 197]MCK1474146.1 hypothetical protein [Bradyrhizobium sp. 197]